MRASSVAAWPPTRYTPPLAGSFQSLYDRYARIVDAVWHRAFGHGLRVWQVELARAILEVYPDGHERAGQLRWRQALVSLGRQNGKTELAAVMAIVGLLARIGGGTVVGIASSVEQANLTYRRAADAVARVAELSQRFVATGTRGIRSRTGSATYRVIPSKSDAVQGIPVGLAIIDELHIVKPALWADTVNGTGGRPNTLVVGLTTAGDDSSELLKRLYAQAADAIADPDSSRLGVFIWEAPSDTIPADDDEFLEWLAAANPSLADGSLDADAVVADARALPPSDILRYRGNRFTTRAASPFIDPSMWHACVTSEAWPSGLTPVFTFERTPDWGYGSVVATARDKDGIIWAQLAQSFVNPSLASLTNAASHLNKYQPSTFAMDGYALGDLAAEMKRRGLPVRLGSRADAINSASLLYAKVIRKQLKYASEPGDQLLAQQVPHAARKAIGQGWRIVRSKGAVDADGVLALALGVLVAETAPEPSKLVW